MTNASMMLHWAYRYSMFSCRALFSRSTYKNANFHRSWTSYWRVMWSVILTLIPHQINQKIPVLNLPQMHLLVQVLLNNLNLSFSFYVIWCKVLKVFCFYWKILLKILECRYKSDKKDPGKCGLLEPHSTNNLWSLLLFMNQKLWCLKYKLIES